MAEPNLDKLNFYSRVNYMKRSDKSGQGEIETDPLVIFHNLGYPPKFMWFADLFGDGMIWYGGEKVFEGTESTAGGGTAPPIVDAWVDEENLTLYPWFFTDPRTAYWLIYLDYGG